MEMADRWRELASRREEGWYGIATGIIMHAYGPSINRYKTGRKCRQVGMQAASLEAHRKNHVIVMHDQMDDPRPRDAATVLLATIPAGRPATHGDASPHG
jgi:hypothetical protein